MKKPRSSGKTLGVAPLFQIARLANFLTSCSFYGCVTIDGNPAFTVHATAHVLRAATVINLDIMLLRQHTWC